MGFFNKLSSIKDKVAEKANTAKTNVVSTAKSASDSINFFGTIANLKEYAVVIVYYLRDNAPEKIMDLVSRMPVVGAAGMLGKFVLGKPMAWLNEQLIKSGEPYIMENLKREWISKDITYDKLKSGIDKIPSAIFDAYTKIEIQNLLDKYFKDENTENSNNVDNQISIDNDKENSELLCMNCGIEIPAGSKFCPTCGEKINNKYMCQNCGVELEYNAKFCPECGTKVVDNK